MKNNSVLIIIPPMDFRDEELFVTKQILAIQNVAVTIVSTVPALTKCYGMLKGEVVSDIALTQVHADDYDGVIVVGGDGASYIWSDTLILKIVSDFYMLRKVVAAISSAPVVLANAGVVTNRRVTVWKSVQHFVEAKGALCTGSRVEFDENIITANGPDSAEQFARSVLKGLEGMS